MQTRGGTRFFDYATARERMAQVIIEASREADVIAFACDQVSGIETGDYPGEAAALAAVARDCIRYTSDTSGEDLYKWPMFTLKTKAGDCNNKVILFGALARSIGFPIQICFLFDTPTPDFSGDFPSHVFAKVDVYKGERERRLWIPVELTPMPDAVSGFPSYAVPFGCLPPMYDKFVDYVDVDEQAGV